MLEKLLKELGEQGYDISWRYEVMTNSIIVRVEKKVRNIPYAYSRMIKFGETSYSAPQCYGVDSGICIVIFALGERRRTDG